MLGIIGAMKAEVEQLKQEMKQPEVVTVAGMEFYKGTIDATADLTLQKEFCVLFSMPAPFRLRQENLQSEHS